MSYADKTRWASEMAKSSLLPEAFRGKPANVLYAAEFAEAVRMSPIVVMQGVEVQNGKLTLSTHLMAALVRRAGHVLRFPEVTDQSATAVLIRSDDPGFEHRATYTVDDARRAGLLSKGTWQKYPRNMLKARAQAEVVRQGAPDALSGIVYLAEEIEPADPQPPTEEEVAAFTAEVGECASVEELIALYARGEEQRMPMSELKAKFTARKEQLQAPPHEADGCETTGDEARWQERQ